MNDKMITKTDAIELMSELEYKPEYFMDRGFAKETVDHFGAGFYLPSDFVVHQRSLIPIHDKSNQLMGFLGRSVHPRNEWDGGFYPEEHLPKEGTGQWYTKWRSYPQSILGGSLKTSLYNINRAAPHISESKSAVIVEGALDCWRSWENGIKNVVAAIGIRVSKDNIELLKSAGCETLNIMFDGDRAGVAGAYSLREKYKDDFKEINIVDVEDGKDPADLGPEEFKKLKAQII